MNVQADALIGGAHCKVGERWETAIYRDPAGSLLQGPCMVVGHGQWRGRTVSVWQPCGPAKDLGPDDPMDIATP